MLKRGSISNLFANKIFFIFTFSEFHNSSLEVLLNLKTKDSASGPIIFLISSLLEFNPTSKNSFP
jgi:hypothetical protein